MYRLALFRCVRRAASPGTQPSGAASSAELAPPSPPWRLTVRRWPALARTRVALSGEADADALQALEHAIEQARERGDAVSLDLGELTSCPRALRAAYRVARQSAPPEPGVQAPPLGDF